ncbi:(2Fe-2S)-binding protein [Collinsella sp. HCP28S3_H5]|uniref:(2Fe-2S)-binding protein n=1 Tax=unclassified Collinsella TaxID=2637548 RepID=UPI003F8A671B
MSRIVEHPILGAPSKGSRVVFTYDGVEMEGYEGESIAMALKAAGVEVHRFTAKRHEPRGIFCAIGRCTDCVMVVDGKPNVRTCMTPLVAGMDVRTQDGVASLDLDDPRAKALVAEVAASPAAVKEAE